MGQAVSLKAADPRPGGDKDLPVQQEPGVQARRPRVAKHQPGLAEIGGVPDGGPCRGPDVLPLHTPLYAVVVQPPPSGIAASLADRNPVRIAGMPPEEVDQFFRVPGGCALHRDGKCAVWSPF